MYKVRKRSGEVWSLAVLPLRRHAMEFCDRFKCRDSLDYGEKNVFGRTPPLKRRSDEA